MVAGNRKDICRNVSVSDPLVTRVLEYALGPCWYPLVSRVWLGILGILWYAWYP